MNTFMLQAQSSSDPATWFVCVLGVGVVFVGLILLIAIVALSNWLLSKIEQHKANNKSETNTLQKTVSSQQAPTNSNTKIENKQEILAAVCAAVAEENGTDISAIRVISFKKL